MFPLQAAVLSALLSSVFPLGFPSFPCPVPKAPLPITCRSTYTNVGRQQGGAGGGAVWKAEGNTTDILRCY